MTTEQIALAILSSSLISGILGAFIAGLYNLRAKKLDYVNEYYKTVISKRIAAYEELEKLIVSLKTAILGKDNRPYHSLFFGDDPWPNAYRLIFEAMSQALWLSDDVFQKIRDLNYLLFPGDRHEGGAEEFGKQNYQVIATLREEIERIHRIDMLSLHDVNGFLKRKKGKTGFHEVKIHG